MLYVKQGSVFRPFTQFGQDKKPMLIFYREVVLLPPIPGLTKHR